MRSNLIIVATVVTSLLFVPMMASADQVQEQLRLMEQRMAEMEDRLQATSVELQTAKATVDQQQGLLTDAGLIDVNDLGIRSGDGSDVKSLASMVDVDGVIAASYNQRLMPSGTNTGGTSGTVRGSGGDGGNSIFNYPNSNTFQLDQAWVNISKTPTEESRGGFHIGLASGVIADAQGGAGDFQPYVYDAYVSFLFDCACGLQVDAGLLPTVFGAEVLQTDQNFFATTGLLFGLQPVTYTGVMASGKITDTVGYQVGIVNEVYDPTMESPTADKAYFARVSMETDKMTAGFGVIHGSDHVNAECGNFGGSGGDSDCNTTVVDLVMTANPTKNLSLWANADYAVTGGEDVNRTGYAAGFSVAGRLAVTEKTGIATRVEYVMKEADFDGSADDSEIVTVTGTVDHKLSNHVTARGEVNYQAETEGGANGSQFAGNNDEQVVALLQLLFSF